MRYLLLVLLTVLSLGTRAFPFRPGIPRVTWSTDHFALTIDEKKQDLLPKLAPLAEECYAKEKAFFGYEPMGRINIAFLDEQDYANGSAYSAQKWVLIYMHAGDIQLRGRTRWLPGVLAHEIGHIFTLREMGDDSHFLGAEAYQDWRGNSGSHFHEGLDWTYGRVPPWLAEGLAQFAASVCGYDTLDTHRQMVLRVAAASGALLTPAELKGFAWDGRRNEMIYTQGFSLVSYLFKTYGPKKGNRYLSLAESRGWREAFKPAFGKRLETLYAEWRKDLEGKSHVEDAAGDGDYLLPETPGVYSLEAWPAPLKDGRFLYLSSRDNDYGETDLFLAEGKGGSKRLFRGATSIQPNADGASAVFTATRFAFRQGNAVSELYRYDAESGSIEALTENGRVLSGCEVQGVAYGIRNDQGRTSVIRIANGEFTTVFSPPDSMELTQVAPGPTPGTLTVCATSGFGGDIYELDLAARTLSPLADSPQDERDPHWAGQTLYFSADYGGAFDVYALADEQVTRITHVAGGAFQPYPVDDGVWFSSYGWKGYRLAKAKPLGESAPAFTVELPVPAWKPPPEAEYEPDTYDHTNPTFLGWDMSVGVIRSPGYTRSIGPADTVATPFAFEPGSRLLTTVGARFKNPTGVVSFNGQFGLSQSLDYEEPLHPDESALEARVDVFLPTLVLGGTYSTQDMPRLRVGGSEALIYYQAAVVGYGGFDWRLAEHWYASARAKVENDFGYQGMASDKNYDSDPRFGGTLDLDFSDLDQGKDGIVRGYSAFVGGEIPPDFGSDTPDFSGDAGVSVYGSLNRFLFLSGSLYHSEDWGAEDRGWVYGDATAHCAIPLGMQLGTRGGAGVYLDAAYPAIGYQGMARFALDGASGTGYRAGIPGYQASYPGAYLPKGFAERSARLDRRGHPAADRGGWDGANSLLPTAGFYDMIRRVTSHEVSVSLTLKTLTFFANPEHWTAGVSFDAADFGWEPVWSVSITL